MNPELDPIMIILIGIIIIFFVAAFIFALVRRFDDFTRELRYINQEVHRTKGGEREHWKRVRRRHWLSLLPFYRR